VRCFGLAITSLRRKLIDMSQDDLSSICPREAAAVPHLGDGSRRGSRLREPVLHPDA
jgi:hypothetical protein